MPNNKGLNKTIVSKVLNYGKNRGGVSKKQKLLIGNIGYQIRDLHPNWRFSYLQLQDVFNFLTCFNCNAEIRGLFAFCIFKSPINNFNLNKVRPVSQISIC